MTYRTEVEVTNPTETHVRESVVQRQVVEAPDPLGVVRRFIVFIFGLIQLLLILRIVLLLFAARGSNDIVAAIYNISDIFVAPFRGILGRNEIQSGSTELDVAAIVALIGWTVIELVVLALLRVFRPGRTA
ncbi:MAG: YggT family protein [Actinomycetota bacterium]|nr:YggT family protein [Actinomycetota bacterium]